MQNENKGCTMCIVGKKEIQQIIEPIKQVHLECTHGYNHTHIKKLFELKCVYIEKLFALRNYHCWEKMFAIKNYLY
jgi:hypothetical protein